MGDKLVESGVLTVDPELLPPAATAFPSPTHGLTFGQQKELLLMQMEHEKLKRKFEVK